MLLINTTDLDLDFLVSEVGKRFKEKCSLEKQELGIKTRGQILAEEILKKFESQHEKTLIITDRDLGAVGLNFVFGQADPANSIAVVSVFRLLGQNLKQRMIKEAVHELGHLFFLSHCRKPCVMSFSNSVFDVDEKSPDFCEACEKKLH